MERTFSDSQLLGGLVLVALLAVAGGQARFLKLQRRLGIEQLLASGFLFLPLGMLLSEAGVGLINAAVVREFEALVTLGLGVLGLLIGLRMDAQRMQRRGDGTLLQAAAIESVFTLVLVGVPLFVLLEVVAPGDLKARASAAALLACSAAISGGQSLSAASRSGLETTLPNPVSRVADYGTVFGVVAAGVLLAVLTPSDSLGPLEKLLALAAIGSVGGLCAWLLASDTRNQALRTTLLLGVVLVTAGTAAHLSLPPVAATLISGVTIAALPGTLAKELRKSLAFLEGPLLILLLVIAGAALQIPSKAALAVLAIYLLLRTAGKILGGVLASKATRHALPERMGLGLLPSSAVALGLALDFNSAAEGPLGNAVMITALFGALFSETAGVWTTRLLAKAVSVTDAAEETPPPAPPAEAAEEPPQSEMLQEPSP